MLRFNIRRVINLERMYSGYAGGKNASCSAFWGYNIHCLAVHIYTNMRHSNVFKKPINVYLEIVLRKY